MSHLPHDDDDDDVPQLVDESMSDQPASASASPSSSHSTLHSNHENITIQHNLAQPIPSSSSSSSASASGSVSVSVYVRPSDAPPVPLTILTGWLGAGKTTLLTRIIGHFGSIGQSIAIIQNEASSFGVEMGLQLQDDSGAFSSLLELSNGCICCSIKSDFVLGVEELLKRKPFEYILLECSGLADPGPLAQIFWVDPELESSVYLDGIISVVDAKHLPRHLTSHHELESRQVIHQIAYADRIILNKMDLVTEEEKEKCLTQIRKINSAQVYCTEKSEVDFEKILHINAFDVNDTTRAVMPPLESADSSASNDFSHPHDSTITTFMWDDLDIPPSDRRPVDLHKLKLWLVDLLWADSIDEGEDIQQRRDRGEMTSDGSRAPSSSGTLNFTPPTDPNRRNEIFRLKAIMPVTNEEKPTFLQGVQQLYDLQSGGEWPKQPTTSNSERFTRFVFIGRRLDHQLLRDGVKSIFADKDSL